MVRYTCKSNLKSFVFIILLSSSSYFNTGCVQTTKSNDHYMLTRKRDSEIPATGGLLKNRVAVKMVKWAQYLQ